LQYEEIYAPEIDDFVYITDNAYTASELRAMEGRILSSLGFALGRPIAINFLRRFSKAGDVDVVHHTLAKYILEVNHWGEEGYEEPLNDVTFVHGKRISSTKSRSKRRSGPEIRYSFRVRFLKLEIRNFGSGSSSFCKLEIVKFVSSLFEYI